MAALAAIAATGASGASTSAVSTYIELTEWRMHNSAEQQEHRVSEFLQSGLTPSVAAAGGRVIGAFGNVIGQNGPYYVTLTHWRALSQMQTWLEESRKSGAYREAMKRMAAGNGLPFVRVESCLLRCFDVFPEPAVVKADKPRIFELRTYDAQSFAALETKVEMFNTGEAKIFERLGFRPVFFGEAFSGPQLPHLTYMLSYDSLAARDQLWNAFIADAEFTALRSKPGYSDAEIVANISNAILRPLPFSPIG